MMFDHELIVSTLRAHALMALHRLSRWCLHHAERGLREEIRYWEAKR